MTQHERGDDALSRPHDPGEEDQNKLNDKPAFPVVGLGTSAGGVRALQQFFGAMPTDTGMAFVVIMHLSPDHESRVAAILQNTTTMPVMQVDETVALEPNRVYVISPTKHLSMFDGMLEVIEPERLAGRHVAIDVFFRTLAETHRDHAVGIVLSGSGADGSVGIKRLKETGGVAIAQEPGDAEYDGMPRNAINTGVIDWVLPVAEMPKRLIALWQNAEQIRLPIDAEAPVVDASQAGEQALHDVLATVRVRTGHDFTHYKRATILRRIERRMQVCTMQTLPAYRDYLREQPQEATLLLHDLLIGVTNFFRDRQAFDALEREVVPLLFAGKTTGDTIRVWVAGCSSGEEAYSVTMLLLEYAAGMMHPPNIQVFATDIDEPATQLAREGSYPASIEADVSAARLRQFFSREAAGYRINKQVRERVLFAMHNLIKDPPFGRCDLVTCRNLLIYLNRTAQEQVFGLFHFALRRDGFLFLGSSESVDGASELFTPLDAKHRLFRAQPSGRALRDIPVLPFEVPSVLGAPASRSEERRRIAFGELHQRMLEYYAPPSIVVNADNEIVHLSDQAGRFIQLGGGEPTLNLLAVVLPPLRAELRTALFQAFQSGKVVEARRVQIERDGQTSYVNMIVRPQYDQATQANYALVLFAEVDNVIGTKGTRAEGDDAEPELRHLHAEIQQLRVQVHTTSERYETSLEELKASNEELQAINEEFRSTTEELETSKEELQSVNEELRTVNQALNATVEEVSAANDDLSNLVSSTGIATVFLDRALRIKRYTPRAQDIFNLLPLDEGRLLSDITNTLRYADMLRDASTVLRTLQPVEREVSSSDERWFLARVVPYRTLNDHIEGVVLTFVDITVRKRAEDVMRASDARQTFLLTLSDALSPLADPVAIEGEACRILGEWLDVDRAYYVEVDEEAGVARVARDWVRNGGPSLVGKHRMADFGWSVAILRRGAYYAIADTQTSDLVPPADRPASAALQIIACVGTPLIKAGRLVGALCVTAARPRPWDESEVELLREVGQRIWAAVERARAEAARRESEEKYQTLFTSIDEAFALCEIITDAQGTPIDYQMLDVNPAFEQMTGITPATAVGKTARELVPDIEEWWIETYGRVALRGETTRFEYRVEAMDRWFDAYASPFGETNSGQFTLVFKDITERKRVEDAMHHAAELNAFRVRLTDALHPLSDPLEIQGEASRLLGEHLRVERVAYAEIEGQEMIVWCDYTNGVPSMVGRYPKDAFGTRVMDAFFNSGTYVLHDAQADADLSEAEKATYRATNVSAYAGATVFKQEKLAAAFAAHSATPRMWTDDEVRLIAEVADRIWTAVERARAEAALAESEERARTLVKNLPGAAVFIFDRDLRYVLADGESLYAAGRTPADFEGKLVDEVLLPVEVKHLAPPLRRALGGEMFEAENTDGGITFISRGVPLRDEGGDVTGVLVVSYNITERKQAEEALERAYAAERLARNEAEAALYVRDQFLSVAPHELRTPLTSLLGYTNMLAMPTAHGSDTSKRMAERISRQAVRLNALIEQLLDVSRLQQGQFAIQPEPVDVAVVVAQVVDETRATLPPNTKHRIELTLPDEPVVIASDAQRLEQVVQNLLSNAVKYSPDGSSIQIGVRTQRGEAVIEVADQGVGIGAEAQARLFKPFYRAPNVGQQISGFGLGLYIIREIVKRHGGRIEVESEEGRGSTFRVVLPPQAAA